MTQIIGSGGTGGYAKLCDVVADVPYECWEGEKKAISGDKVYAKVSAMDETLSTALQPGDNVSELVNDANYIDNTVSDLCNYTLSCNLCSVATSGKYCDLSGTPTIGNGKLTLCRNGSCLIEYCANQTSNSGVDISVPTCTSQLTNNSGYIDNTVNDLQNYTLSSNLCTVATSGKYCDLTGTPTIGNATLTIQKNCTTLDTFTANATTNKTINIPVPTDNCELANSCGYAKANTLCTVATTGKYCDLTGTPNLCAVATSGKYCDLSGTPNLCTVATTGKYCDLTGQPTIPTDNCELANGCGYISGISCSDVTTALGYTPYDSANPSGYTTCTGTLVASDLIPYAKSCDLKTVATTGKYCDLIGTPALCAVATTGKYCDLSGLPTIPTDNCQLANSCGYTTCTGTLVASDLTPYAKSCDLKAVATSGKYCDLTGTPALCTVATTGKYCDLTGKPTIPTVIDNLTSTSTTNALSANQGKALKDMIDDLSALGKFLSLWDSTTGLPISFPQATPYTYSTGDYFLVETIGTTNYKPTGSSYTGVASTTVETDEVDVGDIYIYDGTTWLLQINHGKTVSFANLSGSPEDNTALSCALGDKQDVCNLVTTLSGADDTHYPSAKAVADALSSCGAGDMLKATYDPCNKNANAFDYNNFINTPTIPTNNNQLTNGCGYTTCTGTLVASDLTPYAKTCTLCTVATSGKYCDLTGTPTIPTNNNQLANGCGYTTCTGTLVASDLNGYATTASLCTVATSGKYCDLTGTPTIPAAQIQSDWTQTCSACKDYIKNKPSLCTVATSGKYCDLSGTPTLCTVATTGKYCDLSGTPSLCTVATSGKYCDLSGLPTIPTDNCQLANSCGYTTCIGTITSADLAGYAQTSSLCTVATTGAYSDLTGTPTLCTVATSGKYCDLTGQPTIGSATLSICRNCTLVNAFGANATSNVSVNIDVPTDTCELSNTAGFITSASVPTDNCQLSNGCGYTTCTGTLSTCSDIITTLGYTPASPSDVNTKTFYMTTTGSGTTAKSEGQAIYDWYAAGKNPIVIYSNMAYTLKSASSSMLDFYSYSYNSTSTSYSYSAQYYVRISFSSGVVSSTSASSAQDSPYVLSTNTNYGTPYTPTYAGSPATKKYVDDSVGSKLSNDTTCTTSTVTGIWAGSEAEYGTITNPSGSVLYFTF